MDNQLTGEALKRLVIDVTAAIAKNHATMTPLGLTISEICDAILEQDRKDRNAIPFV